MPRARIHVIPTRGPDDVSGLQALIADGELQPDKLIAILGKTEGNGCVNDFTRAFAVSAFKRTLGEAAEGVSMVMSGGTEGALSPHIVTFEVLEVTTTDHAMAIGAKISPDIAPHQIGTFAQIECVAAAVREAIEAADISTPEDVHFVQVKCPLLTADRVARSAEPVVTADTLKSMGQSRGASALGVALALGEIDEKTAQTTRIGHDTTVWSGRASTSAGVELMGHEILVLGMSNKWSGPLVVDHAIMNDAIDSLSVSEALARLGVGVDARLRAVFAKAEASTSGRVRGHRHTMLDDSDISSTRHARAFVGGVLAGLTGRTDLFISGGAEHQGPDGGGPVAVIAERF
ncbi:MAG: ring-opening amidohydrolase [Paracoccaceae bacterium]|nr:ring-opening amidohydrolase [Paracoccaceae bacterium]